MEHSMKTMELPFSKSKFKSGLGDENLTMD